MNEVVNWSLRSLCHMSGVLTIEDRSIIWRLCSLLRCNNWNIILTYQSLGCLMSCGPQIKRKAKIAASWDSRRVTSHSCEQLASRIDMHIPQIF